MKCLRPSKLYTNVDGWQYVCDSEVKKIRMMGLGAVSKNDDYGLGVVYWKMSFLQSYLHTRWHGMPLAGAIITLSVPDLILSLMIESDSQKGNMAKSYEQKKNMRVSEFSMWVWGTLKLKFTK